MTHWWLIIRTPDGMHIYELGEVDGEDLSAAIMARAAEVGVPDDWYARPEEGWELSLTAGEPHPSVMEQATTVTRLEGAA
jgi:hypothetical protein